MAAKSIIQIEVDDEAFKKFKDLFDKHQAALKELPGQWGVVGKSLSAISSPFSKFAREVQKTSAEFKKATGASEKLVVSLKAADRTVTSLVRGTASLAKNIVEATASLLKWAGITSLLSGVIGAGGLFGIGRLAQSVSSSRRESMGLGVSSGQLKALELSYGKAVDVQGLLSRINEARQDVTKRPQLYASGVTEADLMNKDNAALLRQLIPALRERYLKNPGQAANVPYLTSMASLEELTRLGGMRKEELDAMREKSVQDEKLLVLNDRTQQAWQNLSIQLSRAGEQIENIFVRKLAPLAGPLSKLSDAVAGAIDTLMDTKVMSRWIDDLATAIDRFAKYLKSDEFKSDIVAFMDGLDRAAGALWSFASTVGKIFNPFSERTLKASELARIEQLRALNPELAEKAQKQLENPSQQNRGVGTAYAWNAFDLSHRNMEDRARAAKILNSLGLYLPATKGGLGYGGVAQYRPQPVPQANVPAPRVNAPAPQINVPAPQVNVPAPQVNVPVPKVNVPTPQVSVRPQVNVPAPQVNVTAPDVPEAWRAAKIPQVNVRPQVNVPVPRINVPTPQINVRPQVDVPTPQINVRPQVNIPTPRVNVQPKITSKVSIPDSWRTPKPPQVNVSAPQVNVPAPQVNVPAPQVNVPAPQVNVPAPQISVPKTSMPEEWRTAEIFRGASKPRPVEPAMQGPELNDRADPMLRELATPRGYLAKHFEALERARNLPMGILDRLYKAESNRGKQLVSKVGAEGPFQFMPKTAKEYGLNTREAIYDVGSSSRAAADYLQNLLRTFKGDLAKAVAAYNWGASKVQAAEAKAQRQGGTWFQYAPAETQREVRVTISQAPGSDVIALTHAAAVAQ